MKISSVALLCAFAVTAPAADWPQFRGPAASGVASTASPPLHWDATKGVNIAWTAEIPGLAVSSPIVWGDRIYLTTAVSGDPTQKFRTGQYGDTDSVNDPTPHQWFVLALDKSTGKVLWRQLAHQGVPKTKRHPKSSQASATPATNGSVVVAWFGSEGLYCYSAEGKLLWKKDLGIQNAGWFFDPDSEWGVGSSPVIYKNSVIVLCDRQKDSFIAAFNLKDGRELWRTARVELPTWGTPTLVETARRVEVVTNGSKGIRGYDADSGRELWTLGPNSELVCTTPVAADGIIYVTAGYPPVAPIYAVKAGSSGDLTLKQGQQSSDSIAWSKSSGGVYLPSPIAYDGLLYTVSNGGVVTAYDGKSGNRVYQQRLGGDSFVASPVAAAGNLFIASEDGDVYVVKAGAKYELLAKNPIGEAIIASPAFAGDMLLVRGTKRLFAIAEKNR